MRDMRAVAFKKQTVWMIFLLLFFPLSCEGWARFLKDKPNEDNNRIAFRACAALGCLGLCLAGLGLSSDFSNATAVLLVFGFGTYIVMGFSHFFVVKYLDKIYGVETNSSSIEAEAHHA